MRAKRTYVIVFVKEFIRLYLTFFYERRFLDPPDVPGTPGFTGFPFFPGFPDIPAGVDVAGVMKALPSMIKVPANLKRLSENLRKLRKSPEKLTRLTGSPFKNVGLSLSHIASIIPSAQNSNSDLNIRKMRAINNGIDRVNEAATKVNEHIELVLKGSKVPKDSTDLFTGFQKITDGANAFAKAISKVRGLGGAAFGYAVKGSGVQKSIKEASAGFVALGNLQKDPSAKAPFKALSTALQRVTDAVDNLTNII